MLLRYIGGYLGPILQQHFGTMIDRTLNIPCYRMSWTYSNGIPDQNVGLNGQPGPDDAWRKRMSECALTSITRYLRMLLKRHMARLEVLVVLCIILSILAPITSTDSLDLLSKLLPLQ